MAKFLGGEEQRRGLFFRGGPPTRDRGNLSELLHRERAQGAENVQVGVALLEIAARGRAVENYGLQLGGGGLQLLDQLREFVVHGCHYFWSITSCPKLPRHRCFRRQIRRSHRRRRSRLLHRRNRLRPSHRARPSRHLSWGQSTNRRHPGDPFCALEIRLGASRSERTTGSKQR